MRERAQSLPPPPHTHYTLSSDSADEENLDSGGAESTGLAAPRDDA